MSYTSIHTHTCYSVRDAVTKIEDYVQKCKDLKMTAACISDHGNMHGAYKLYKECKKQEIKPIIAQEFYYADNAEDKGENYHLLLIAKNNIGFQNLCKLSSYAFINGFYKKPRIDKSVLAKYSEGIICSTACVFGKAQQLVVNNEIDAAVAEINALEKIFGEDLYLEIADHQLEDENLVRETYRNMVQNWKDFKLNRQMKIVAATDSHYLEPKDKALHNIFKQIAYNSVGSDKDDSFPGTGYHIWTPEEMYSTFRKEEVDATNEIADKCSLKFEFTGYHLPKFPVPEGKDEFDFLKDLAYEGLKKKGLTNKKYLDRLEYELFQIHLMDLESYFLIVWDMINYCRTNNILTGPGRGSAAGALVAYAIGVTKVDPLKYDLLFARCLNPGRALQYDFGVQ